MTPEAFHQTPPGLYVVRRFSGATGLAAIGERWDGGRWIACTHWFTIGDRESRRAIEGIDRLDLIETPQGAGGPESTPESPESPQKADGA